MKKTLLLAAVLFFHSSLLKVLPFGESGEWGWWASNGTSCFAQSITISAGYIHSYVLCADSTLMAWGDNAYGQLGDNSVTDRWTPVKVHGPGNVGYLDSIVSIASGGGYHTLALHSNGTVWAWGDNYYAQLGIGTSGAGSYSSVPVQVHGFNNVGYLTNIIAIAVGQGTSMALQSDGTVWSWGYNYNGITGNATWNRTGCQCQATPVQVVNTSGGPGLLTGIVKIASGYEFDLALKSDGTVYAWGKNGYNQVGNTTVPLTERTYPVQVMAGASGCGSYLCNIIAIAGGMYHALALKSDGTVWGWGRNNVGQLGDGTSIGPRTTPVQTVTGASGCATYLCNITSINSGQNSGYAIKSDSTLWAWGPNTSGSLGDGTTTPSLSPVQVVTGASGCATNLCSVISVSGGKYAHTLALKRDGSLWSWGLNNDGQLGNGTGWPGSGPNSYTLTPIAPTGLCNVMALPVELLEFNAVAEDNVRVKCYWSTATEINSDYFAVERSQYGTIFEQIGTVKGAGSSSVTLNYVFYDHEPYSGISYYRLRPVDYDGTFSYSQIRAVYIGTLDLITIYPNPSTDGSIEYTVASEAGGELSVKVYDVLGRKVISNTETIEGGVATKKLSTAGLSSGSYLLQVTNGDLEKTQKQFVIR